MSCDCLNCGTPGFRFHPTDEELIDRLRNKILGVQTPGRPIAVVDDLGKLEPREIPELTTNSWDSDQTCYFFWSPVYKKNGISRTAKNGFWKATGKVRKVKGKKKVIGQKKTLVFYESGSPTRLTPWVIHEYHLIESGLCHNKEKYVLCKLKLKDDGKAAISSPAEAQSTISLPFVFSGNNGELQPAHSPASSTCNVNREESLSIYMPSSFKNACFSSGDKEEMNNATSDYQVSMVLDSAQKASLGHHHPELDSQDYESGSDLPDNDGSHMAWVSLPDDHMDPAKLGSAEGYAESCFINASPLQMLNGEGMVTWEQTPIADSFSFDNGGFHNQSSTDEKDEQGWKSFLADPIEDCIGEENHQQHVVSGIESPDTVSTSSTKRSSRKRLREEGDGFSDENTETSRVKVGVEGQANMTPTVEEREQNLSWALRSECRRQDLISYDGDESLFFSHHVFGSHTELQATPEGRPPGGPVGGVAPLSRADEH